MKELVLGSINEDPFAKQAFISLFRNNIDLTLVSRQFPSPEDFK